MEEQYDTAGYYLCPVPDPDSRCLASRYLHIADRMDLPYPRLFAPDFMLSSALVGCLVFGFMFAGTVLGTILWAVVVGAVKMFGEKR